MSTDPTNGGRPKIPLAPRFWSKVNVGDLRECWEWDSAFDAKGYGAFFYNGRTRRAHHVALLLSEDSINTLDELPGDVIRHTCDNPACVNPKHLTPGTQSENIKDHVRRTRDDRLTDDEIREIRRKSDEGATYVELGEEYDRHRSNISAIVRRESFDWVD